MSRYLLHSLLHGPLHHHSSTAQAPGLGTAAGAGPGDCEGLGFSARSVDGGTLRLSTIPDDEGTSGTGARLVMAGAQGWP